ncbi:MAG: OmpA family protein [Deltaproteobacteria bacterium]|nr:OmpA family protein [Deltaproteobacteria bacterium]
MLRKSLVGIICLSLFAVSGCMVSKKDYLLKSGEAEKCATDLSRKTDENLALKKELSSTQESLQQQTNRGDECEKNLQTVTGERDGLRGELDKSEAVNEELRSQNDRLGDLLKSKEISQSQIIQETMNINKRLQGTNADLREKIVAKDAEFRILRTDLERVKSENDALKVQKEEELQKLKAAYDELVSGLKTEIEAGEIQIKRMKDRLSVNMVEKILFDSGKADLKQSGIAVLSKVGTQLNRIKGKRIQIEGHTDNVPIGGRLKEKFPSNWELSSSRALAVVHFLQDKIGIDPEKLSAAGYGEYQPVASNETAEGKAANRRIEIVLLPPYEKLSEAQESTN